MFIRLLIVLLLAAIPSVAQKLPSAPNASDAKGRQGKWVILFDNKWKEITAPGQVEFYRAISYLDDKPVGVVEDHYKNGKLQFNSKLVADRPKNVYDGEASWYYETGTKRITIEFANGTFVRRVGVWLRNGRPATADFTALNNQGIELTSEGKTAEAEVAYQVALENVEAMYTKRSPTYLVIERNLIDALFVQEKYKEAAKHSQELVTLDLDVLPAEDPTPVDDISYWSTAAQLAGASQDDLMKIDLLGVEEGRKRGKPASYFYMLVSLGTTYKNQDRIVQALPLLEEAWASKKMEGDQTYELLVYSLGGIYSEGRRYKESVAVFREAQAVFQRSPENAKQAQAMLGYMAIDLQLAGDLKGALTAFRQELEILKANGKGESYSAAQTLSNIGIISSELGQLVEAERALLQAESIFDRDALTEVQDRRTLYAALQTLYDNLGKKDKANIYGKKLIGVGIASKGTAVDPFNLLATMNDIGYHVDKHNMITARKKLIELLRAMESQPKLSQDDQRLYASLLATSGTLRIQELDSMFGSLGATASERIKRYDDELRKIETMLRKALVVQGADTTVAGKQSQTVTLFQLALVFEKLDVNTDSVVTAVMMNAWRFFPKASKQQIELLAYCASISQLNYSDSKSITDLYRVIFQLLQTYRQQTLPYLSEAGQTGYLKTSRYLLDNFISFAVEESGNNPDIAGFLYDEVLRNKGLILHSLSQTRRLIAEGKDAKLLELFDQWKHLKNELALASGMDEMTRKAKKLDITALQQQSEDAETRLAAVSAEFRKYKIEQPFSWKNIVAKLNPGEAAVEIVRSVVTDYDRKDSIYAALVLRPGSKPALIRIPNASAMENRMLKAYRNAIKFKTTPGMPDSYKVYWGELAKGLAGAKKVYFSPDGVYHLISISSLYNTGAKKYLVDEIDVQLVSSTAALLAAQPGNTEWKRGIVLFGSPDFGSGQPGINQPQGRNMSLDNVLPLPGAEKELGDVGKLFESSGVSFREYKSAQATEAQLKSVENPYVLHIATHGYFIPDMSSARPDIGSAGSAAREDPMLRSGLLLAQCCNGSRNGTKNEDGVLTAYEASTLSLGKTQLVVLSACDTGLGEVSFGEGVYGLQRAFLESGASSLLMSLWKVDDAATQQLMTDFYREWLKGSQAHEALRIAQQKLRTKSPEPYYWAGFVAVRK